VSTGRAGIGWLCSSPPKAVSGCRGTSVPIPSGAAAGDPVAVPTCTARLPPSGGAAGACRRERRWFAGLRLGDRRREQRVASDRVRAMRRGRGGGPLGPDDHVSWALVSAARGRRFGFPRAVGHSWRASVQQGRAAARGLHGRLSSHASAMATSRAHTRFFRTSVLRRTRVDSTVEGRGWCRAERNGLWCLGFAPRCRRSRCEEVFIIAERRNCGWQHLRRS